MKAAFPTQVDVDLAKLATARNEWKITDTDRINALISLFGGHYAFPVMWQVKELFQNGRAGLDAFLALNPSLVIQSEKKS